MPTALDNLFNTTPQFGIQPVSNVGTQRTSTKKKGRTATAKDLAAGANQFIAGVDPRSSTVDQAPAARVQRALTTLQTPVQNSRASAEAGINPAIAENLRLNMNEQQRLNQVARGPGAMNPVEFRALLKQQALNQNAINGGAEAVGAMGNRQVTAEGNQLSAATTLTDRLMAEAGANDRAQLNLDKTALQGQYGLGQEYLRGSLQNEGIVAGKQTLNPLQAIAAGIATDLRSNANESGDPLYAFKVNQALLTQLTNPNSTMGIGSPQDLVELTINGQTLQVPRNAAETYGTTALVQALRQQYGNNLPYTDQQLSDIVTGTKTQAQVLSEMAQERQKAAEEEQQRREQIVNRVNANATASGSGMGGVGTPVDHARRYLTESR